MSSRARLERDLDRSVAALNERANELAADHFVGHRGDDGCAAIARFLRGQAKKLVRIRDRISVGEGSGS